MAGCSSRAAPPLLSGARDEIGSKFDAFSTRVSDAGAPLYTEARLASSIFTLAQLNPLDTLARCN